MRCKLNASPLPTFRTQLGPRFERWLLDDGNLLCSWSVKFELKKQHNALDALIYISYRVCSFDFSYCSAPQLISLRTASAALIQVGHVQVDAAAHLSCKSMHEDAGEYGTWSMDVISTTVQGQVERPTSGDSRFPSSSTRSARFYVPFSRGRWELPAAVYHTSNYQDSKLYHTRKLRAVYRPSARPTVRPSAASGPT